MGALCSQPMAEPAVRAGPLPVEFIDTDPGPSWRCRCHWSGAGLCPGGR